MTNALTITYFVYMFIAIYFLSLFAITFFQNRKEIFLVPKSKKSFSVSVLIPAFNEQDSLEETVESVLKTDYKNLMEIIIINDGSTDNTLKIARGLQKKHSNIIVLNKKNSGKADSLNHALKIAKGELVAVVDADSFPDSCAITSMAGYFEDEKTGAVTTRILVRKRDNFLKNMQ